MRHCRPLAIGPAVIAVVIASGQAFGQPQPFQPSYEDGIARRGQDYRSFQPTGPSALYCQQACMTDTHCRAWSYAPPSATSDKQSICWLKGGVPPAAPAQGMVSGVVRPDGADVAANPPGVAKSPPAPTAPGSPAAETQRVEYKRTVRSNADSLLAHERSWDANCQPLPLLVTVTRQPGNGKLQVIQGPSTIPDSTPRGGSTGACAGKPMVGNQIMYRSGPGFHGTDTAAYDLTYANGRRQSIDVTIEVQEAPSPAAAQSKSRACTVASGREDRCTSHQRIDGRRQERLVVIDVTVPPSSGKVTTKIVDAPFEGQPAHATAIYYQSNPGFVGQDNFTYRRHSDDPDDPFNGIVTMTVTVK